MQKKYLKQWDFAKRIKFYMLQNIVIASSFYEILCLAHIFVWLKIALNMHQNFVLQSFNVVISVLHSLRR